MRFWEYGGLVECWWQKPHAACLGVVGPLPANFGDQPPVRFLMQSLNHSPNDFGFPAQQPLGILWVQVSQSDEHVLRRTVSSQASRVYSVVGRICAHSQQTDTPLHRGLQRKHPRPIIHTKRSTKNADSRPAYQEIATAARGRHFFIFSAFMHLLKPAQKRFFLPDRTVLQS